jgi:nicotinate-nucleotide adenylyltransferase
LRIGIFGGTFSPPHLGHSQLAILAETQLRLDRLIVVPTGEPPHKDVPDDAPGGDARLHMARFAFDGIANTEVSDFEVSRGGVSYTADTVDAFAEMYPGARLFLVMGQDMYMTVGEWWESERLLSRVTLAVAPRFSASEGDIAEQAARLKAKFGVETEILRGRVTEISSSELRGKLKSRAGREYVDENVYSYIIEGRLYGAKPDFDWLRERAYELLKPGRVPHVQGCEAEAVHLAERYGADVDEAREAGILHDITKKLDGETQLRLCEEYGIELDEQLRAAVKVLHSKTGAALAKAKFGVSDDVQSAICWHSTGRPDMTLLEKIIYIADYIEPTRAFDGVDELRRLAYEDLDRAIIMGLEMSIDDLNSRGDRQPHPVTLEALAYLKARV